MIKEYIPNEEAIAKSRENLAQAKPVAELTGNEFGKGETNLFNQVSDYFDNMGNSVYNVGTVQDRGASFARCRARQFRRLYL